jgi:hypothetical protein
MEYLAIIGLLGFIFGMAALSKVQLLEKKLTDEGILKDDKKSKKDS